MKLFHINASHKRKYISLYTNKSFQQNFSISQLSLLYILKHMNWHQNVSATQKFILIINLLKDYNDQDEQYTTLINPIQTAQK